MKSWVVRLLYPLLCILIVNGQFCSKDSGCSESLTKVMKPRFLLYDVNHGEGFNLRRDVFMRLAIFMHSLHKSGYDWHLVLPPWPRLYHWKSMDIKQSRLPWNTFFDVDSLKRFAPVIEFQDFLHEINGTKIEKVYFLQHFENAFSQKNWDWTDRWTITQCGTSVVCREAMCHDSTYVFQNNSYHGWFWGYSNISASSLECVSFQGPASQLKEVLESDTAVSNVMIDHAEIVVHDTFGDSLYWKCRRSMRFAKHLREEADYFRTFHLGGNDEIDKTVRPVEWEKEELFQKKKAVGGPYMCAHLRRADFLSGRSNQVPSLEFAAKQINDILQRNNLSSVFIASDASPEEIQIFFDLLKPAKAFRFEPKSDLRKRLKDGGVAIVDQIICSYARYFIGTHESTFTFRIQEEREIIGFPSDTTYNVFCAKPKKCFDASRWKIVY